MTKKEKEERIKELKSQREELIAERIEILLVVSKFPLQRRFVKLNQAKVESIDRNIKRINEELLKLDPNEKENIEKIKEDIGDIETV